MTCHHKVWVHACNVCKPIQFPQDQAWRIFSYTFKPGDTREIHSKRQFQRACKETGQVIVSRDDLVKNGQPYNQPDRTIPKELTNRVMQDVMKEMTPAKVEQSWKRRQRRTPAKAA